MNQQNKQRITQLNNGEIPDGYKKTEFGVFPKEWGLVSLDSLLDFKNGVNADKEKYNSGVKMISVMDILAESPLYYDTIRGQVDIDEKTLDTYSVTYGDLLFQRSSETFEDAGKSNVYLDKNKTATYSGFVIRGKKKAEYQPYYLNEALRIASSRNQIIRNSAGSQHINVGQESLSKVVVPIASRVEQEKIAEILMKWDEAIDLYERIILQLINRKKIVRIILQLINRKKIVMEKLLCVKDGWNSAKLGDISNMYAGGTPSTKIKAYWGGDIPWIQSGLVQNNFIDIVDIDGRITQEGLKNSSASWIKGDSVLIAITGATCANIAYLKCDATANQSVISVTTDTVNPMFLYYYLQRVRNKLLSLQNGSAQGGLTLKYLETFEISFPCSSEQKRIGDILLTVDKELYLQKEQKKRLLLQRKALQQYLLNGIVRV